MPDLATTDDLEVRLGRALTSEETTKAEGLLADTSANVRGYTGQSFTEETTTQRVKIRNGFVLLPQRPVTAVDTVENTSGTAVSFTWDGLERVYVPAQVPDSFSWEPYRAPLSLVDVTYTHGYETVPADIVGVVCGVTLRALGQDPMDGGTTQESIDGYSFSRGTTGAAGGFGLLPDERVVLDRYRRQFGSVQVFS